MLGITVPDAVLIGTLIVSVLAAWRGTKAGDAASKVVPPEPAAAMIGGAIVDRSVLQELTREVSRLADATQELAQISEKRQHTRIEELLIRIIDGQHRDK